MESDFQCLLMGDVLFQTQVTIGIDLTVSGPTTYSWSEVVDAGTWYSSPVSLAQYMVHAWNALNSGQMDVSLVDDPSEANYRMLKFTPETGLGTVTAFAIKVPEVYADLGLTSANHDLGADSSIKYSAVCPYVLTPYWPPAQYDLGVDNLTGYSEMAHDGSTYSLAGTSQRTVTLSLALDRSSSFDEALLWMAIWRDRWTCGRAVTFLLDRSYLTASANSWQQWMIKAEVLELPSSGEAVDFTRMMDVREVINYTRPIQFVHRQSHDDIEVYNGQLSVDPTTVARVTSWYRAEAGTTLDVLVTMPDPGACAFAGWFRIVSSSGEIVQDSGWAFPLYAGGAMGYHPPEGYNTYEVDFGGGEMAVHPRVGDWVLLTCGSAGGEIPTGLNAQSVDDIGPGGTIDGPMTLGHSAGTVVVEFANLAWFTGRANFTVGERAALFAAGVTFDYANTFGVWAGEEPYVYLCDEPLNPTVDYWVSNSAIGSAEPDGTLTFPGPPVYGPLVTP